MIDLFKQLGEYFEPPKIPVKTKMSGTIKFETDNTTEIIAGLTEAIERIKNGELSGHWHNPKTRNFYQISIIEIPITD